MFRLGELFIFALIWLKNFASPFLFGVGIAGFFWWGLQSPAGKVLAALALVAGTVFGIRLAEYLRKNSPGISPDSEEQP